MAKSAQQIYDEIVAHINDEGSPYTSWYCGITNDAKRRLKEHNVPEKDHWLIYRKCNNESDARAVEEALLKLGCDGGEGGGDSSSVYVYAYLKTSVTNP